MPRADEAHYLSAANAMKARFQTDTRMRLLEELYEWVCEQTVEPFPRPVCVLVGKAGTGKSTIASEFSRRLGEDGRLGASFFFTRGVQDLNSPRKFFSTISSQLARSQPALRIPVINAAREHMQIAVLQRLQKEFEDLVDKPLSALPPSHPLIFVVVDALDECTEEGPELIPTLIRLLLSCATRPGSPLRVFLTSRPEPHYIHEVFTTPNLSLHISAIDIHDFRDEVDYDIKQLIRSRLNEHQTSKAWSDADPSVVPSLVRKSDGLFVYARTAVDFILSDLSDLSSRYLDLLSLETAVGLTDLDELYRTVLRNVLPPQDRYYTKPQERLKRILGYLAALQDSEGLSPAALESLTGMPAVESVPILNRLRSVIFFDRDSHESPFRIIHATFREFLVNPLRAGSDFYVDPGQVHRSLAEDCTKTVVWFRRTEWPNCSGAMLLLWLIGSDRESPANCDYNDTLPHVYYAQEHLLHHHEHSSARGESLEDQLRRTDDDVPHSFHIVRCWYEFYCGKLHVDPIYMWDMVSAVVKHSRSFLLKEHEQLVDALLRVVEVGKMLATCQQQVSDQIRERLCTECVLSWLTFLCTLLQAILIDRLPAAACLCIVLDIIAIREGTFGQCVPRVSKPQVADCESTAAEMAGLEDVEDGRKSGMLESLAE